MVASLQFNPSTFAVGFNPTTKAVQMAVPGYEIGEDCEYCDPGSAPQYVTVSLVNFGPVCAGCFELEVWPSSPLTWVDFYSDILDGSYVLTKTGSAPSCEWNGVFGPPPYFNPPNVNYGGVKKWYANNCTNLAADERTTLYFYLSKISATHAKLIILYRPINTPGPTAKPVVFLNSSFPITRGCITIDEPIFSEYMYDCGINHIVNGWDATKVMLDTPGEILLRDGL